MFDDLRLNRRGSALIEVLIALVVLAVAGTALITIIGQTSHSLRSVERTESEVRDADARMRSLVERDRSALLALVGHTRLQGWSVTVEEVGVDLFGISLAPSDSAGTVLRSVFYRPDTLDAATP